MMEVSGKPCRRMTGSPAELSAPANLARKTIPLASTSRIRHLPIGTSTDQCSRVLARITPIDKLRKAVL
jgi:hypothetical protein